MDVIVTRPAHQAPSLVSALREQGFKAHSVPLLTIEPLSFESPEVPVDGWIFISPNAVEYFAQGLSSPVSALLSGKSVYAIGESTARYLQQRGVAEVIYPQISNSESLLALDPLESVQNQRIILVCGVGGRDTIETTLTSRGAVIERLEVYQRQPVSKLELKLNHPSQPIWILSSAAALEVMDRNTVAPQQVLVTSERLAQLAQQKQHQVCAVSNSALDRDIINCLSQMTAG